MKTPAIIAGVAAVVPVLSDTALKSVAVLLLVAAIVFSLRKASAATRHTIWVFAMIGLLLLPILSFTLPKWSALPSAFNLAPAPTEIEQPVLPNIGPMPAPEAPIVHQPAPPMSAMEPTLTIDLGSALVLLWAAGTVLLFLRLILSHWLLRALARSSRVEPALQARFERTKQSLEISGPVALKVSSQPVMPKSFGFVRPSVILPADAVDWSPSRLQAVLAHELGHIKRRDPLAQLLVQIVCAIYWFNPLVWLAARQIESDRERACDDLVLNHGVKASDYAQHLLEVVTGCGEDRFTACASVGMARPSRLEGRVVSILDDGVNRRSITRALLWVTLVATALAIVPLAMIEAQAQKPPVAPSEPPPANTQPAQPIPASETDSAPDDEFTQMNPIDRLLHQRLKQEGIDLTKLKNPEKLTASQRLNMIRAFYRFFLNRSPSVAELKAAETNWSQSDYQRWAEQLSDKVKQPGIAEPQLLPVLGDLPLVEAIAADPEPIALKETLPKKKLQWSTFVSGGKPYGQPVMRNDRVYLVDADGCLLCLDAKTGKHLWSERKPHQVTDEFVARAYRDLLGRAPRSKGDKMKLLRDLSSAWRARLYPESPKAAVNGSVAMEDEPELPASVAVAVAEFPAADPITPSRPTKFPVAEALEAYPAEVAKTPVTANLPGLTPPKPPPAMLDAEGNVTHNVPFRASTPKAKVSRTSEWKKTFGFPNDSSAAAGGDDMGSRLPPQPAPVPRRSDVSTQKQELARHWRDLVSAREKMRDSTQKRHQTGLASTSDLNRADQSLTESRIGLAKVTNNEKQVVEHLKELVALREKRLSRQQLLRNKGYISENEVLQAREALIEAKIRLAEAVIGNKAGRTGQL